MQYWDTVQSKLTRLTESSLCQTVAKQHYKVVTGAQGENYPKYTFSTLLVHGRF